MTFSHTTSPNPGQAVSPGAPPVIQILRLIALGDGSLILLPSLYYLFRVFKGHTFQLRRTSAEHPK